MIDNILSIAVLPHRMVIGFIEHKFLIAVHVKGLSFKRIIYINNGLITLKELTVSGDGTAVKAHANPFGRNPESLKSLPEDTCTENFRHYSDPDASWGSDSHEKHWYFGRTLYMLVCRNPELSLEVPLLLNFTSAKWHDSINFLFAIDAFGRQGTGLSSKNLCLYKEQLRPPASSPYSMGQ